MWLEHGLGPPVAAAEAVVVAAAVAALVAEPTPWLSKLKMPVAY
jgi:hypothetical protein